MLKDVQAGGRSLNQIQMAPQKVRRADSRTQRGLQRERQRVIKGVSKEAV